MKTFKSDVLYLIKTEHIQDEYGVFKDNIVRRRVFCEVGSIGAQEHFATFKAGFQASFGFVVFFGDYNGEDTVEYEGKQYYIYRQFRSGDHVELYCRERTGGERS